MNRSAFAAPWLLPVGLMLVGCSPSSSSQSADVYPLTPVEYRCGDQVINLGDEAAKKNHVREEIAFILAYYFGSPENPVMPKWEPRTIDTTALTSTREGSLASAEGSLQRGRRLYKQHCVHCHGLYGAGDGPTSSFLLPKPRDFRQGEFKFTSTVPDQKPTHADLKRTIAQGVPGTMMPAFGPAGGLPDVGLFAGFAGPPGFDVDAVSDYVQLLAMRGELEKKLVANYAQDNDYLNPDKGQDIADLAAGVIQAWKDADGQVMKPPAPPKDFGSEESIKKGDELFHTDKAQCMACHGKYAVGDGLDPDPEKRARDVWNDPIAPANLTLGVFRGGRRPVDLYRRVHTGVKGGVMPGFGGQLEPDQIWQLVDYVRSLSRKEQQP